MNLPWDYDGYVSGNGEGVWVEAISNPREYARYENRSRRGHMLVRLMNDSVYYPQLRAGSVVRVGLRGRHRPVLSYRDFQTLQSM